MLVKGLVTIFYSRLLQDGAVLVHVQGKALLGGGNRYLDFFEFFMLTLDQSNPADPSYFVANQAFHLMR